MPDFVRPLVLGPHTGRDLSCEGLDVGVELAHADIADAEFLEELEELLVEEAAVEAEDDGHIPAVVLADQSHHVADHVGHAVAGVGVFLAAPEDGIDQEAAPGHLKWGKALDLLVRGLDTVAGVGLVVVHDHGVDAEDHDGWGLQLETPEEQVQEQATEEPDPGPPEGPKEALDGVRRGHLARLGLDHCRVALILLQLIEADKMPRGAIEEETEELVEESRHWKPFRALAHRAEQAIEVREDLEVTYVAAEQSQATPARQRVGRDLNTIEQRWDSIARGVRLGDHDWHPLG